MIKKNISEKDEKDWKNFVDNISDVPNKDKLEDTKKTKVKRFKFDFHGYSLDDANKKIYSFIKDCFENKVNKIKIITGKGLRSKNTNDPYQSKDLSILKYSVPNYIKKNQNLMNKILKIDFESVESLSKGSFDIILKKKND